MKKLLILVLLISTCFLYPQEITEKRKLTLRQGERLTLPLPLQSSADQWEPRLITRGVLKKESAKNYKDRLELVFLANRIGTARLEATLIRSGRVLKRIYFFISVTKAAVKKPTKGFAANPSGSRGDKKDGKEAAGAKDFAIGRQMFERGFYPDASRYFRLFRKQYPKSPLVPRAKVYEGQSFFSSGDYSRALSSLRSLKKAATDVKQLAALWEGYTLDALGRGDSAVGAFMRALILGGDPEITIRARTGLALHYAKKKKYRLAHMQFRVLFETGIPAAGGNTKKKNSGYLLALYYAGRFYDRTPVVRDINAAYKYYSSFVKLVGPILPGEKNPRLKNLLSRMYRDSVQRMAFLKKNFLDYR